jgi:hypothetical protein
MSSGMVASGVEAKAHTMLRTRLYIECPNCYMQYLMKAGARL